MKALICECCGGRIDRGTMTCMMCGTQYKLDEYEHPIRVVEYSQKVETLSSEVIMPRYLVEHMGLEEAMEMSLKEMAQNMAEKMLPLIEFTYGYEPVRQEYVTYGKLKVANPHTKTGGYKEVRW